MDPKRPLIYLWEIMDRDGEVCHRYVSKAFRGANRPCKHYRRNVTRLLQGLPYRKGKPEAFREIHHRMADAVRSGYTLRLSFLCNVAADENINSLERRWQQHFGLM